MGHKNLVLKCVRNQGVHTNFATNMNVKLYGNETTVYSFCNFKNMFRTLLGFRVGNRIVKGFLALHFSYIKRKKHVRYFGPCYSYFSSAREKVFPSTAGNKMYVQILLILNK